MMKKFTLRMLSLSMLMFLGIFAFGQFTVTFNVDMTDATDFNPATDSVFMAGTFTDHVWAQPGSDLTLMMSPVEVGSSIYTLTTTVDSGEVQYKFFRVFNGPSWDNGEWTGDPNRKVYVVSADNVFNNVWANMPFSVTFKVDMTNADPFDPETDAVYIAGDLANGWAQPGTISAYVLAPENETMVYSITLSLYPGDYAYKYFRVIDGVPSWENGEWTGDPNRAVTVDTTMTVEGVWGTTGIFNIPNEFTYNMYPNPASDFIYLAKTADVNRIDVYDVTGKMVRTAVLNGTQDFSMNVSDLNNGMYIINVTNDKGVQTSKFVKR